MINVDNNFFKNFINLLYIQSIEIIQQSLEDYDKWIFKNYKIDETLKEFKNYKVKDKIERTLVILNGKITFKRRRYYKINSETGKEEYIFPLDKILGIEKWQRIDNSVKEKILLFITENKRYKDILDTMEYVKISLMTVSNIMKNAKTDEEYYFNKSNKKIDIPHTLYIQMDGTYFKMLDSTKQGRKKIKKHTIACTVHTGYDEEKYTVKRPVIANKLGVFEMDNIPDYLKKEADLKPVLIKLFSLIETHFNMIPNIEIMILGDGALWIKNNKEGIENQTLWNNVGCHMEGDISHYWKGTMIKKAIYSEKTFNFVENSWYL